MFVLLAVAFVLINAQHPNPEDGKPIVSRTTWYDTNGNSIQAHGGGFIYEESNQKYYWFGESAKLPESGDWLSEGVNCYSSYDLATWTFEGMVFKNTSIAGMPTGGPYRIERPKVIYNQNTKKYVLWFHLDTASFSLRSVGVATSNSINGPYEWVSGFKPDGMDSYDMSLYKDDDGSAYLVRSVYNQYAGISKLTDDYLNTTGIISKGPRIEGQAIFKLDNNRYYLLGSHLTGWSPNQAVLSISNGNTLNGAVWSELHPITNSSTTYNSQSTFVWPYKHPNGKLLLIFMGDDWNYPNVGGATYVWLPLIINNYSSFTLPFYDRWEIKNVNP